MIDTVKHDSTLTDTSVVVYYEDIYDDLFDLSGDNSVIKWNVAAIAGSDTVLAENGPRYVLADGTSLSVDEEFIPTEFALHQNYPNPFNPVTTLNYDLPEQAHVSIMIYDIMGREIRHLVNGIQEPGFKTTIWDASNNLGEPVSAGMYLYRITALQQNGGQASEFHKVKKMVLLK